MILDYASKAAAAWFLGFFPYLEIYLAVPAAIAMGLDYVSAVVWPVLGNFLPVPLIVVSYRRLLRLRGVGTWLERLASPRVKGLVDRNGPWFTLVGTPWIGVWALAVTAVAAGMDPRKLLLYSFLSITLYAVLVAGLVALGSEAFGPQTSVVRQ